MKKAIIALVLAVGLLMLAGCEGGGGKTETAKPAETTASAATETSAPATQAATQATQAPATEKPAEETQTEARDTQAEEYKNQLIESKYILEYVEDADGNRLDNYYGSIVNQTGAHLHFFEDDTFECVLGANSWKGTYSIEDGSPVLHVAEAYDATGEIGSGYDQKLIWDHDANKLVFNTNGVSNHFRPLNQ